MTTQLPADRPYSLDQYSAVGSVTPTYDGNGNLTYDGSFTYCYDAESRCDLEPQRRHLRLADHDGRGTGYGDTLVEWTPKLRHG